MNQPLVSIIVPAYNAGPYIRETIRSVLAQTYPRWELLVVNDGSTDGTEAAVLAFTDPRIRYFRQENKGVSAARNRALREMQGDYFCFLDADDVYPPNSLQSRLAVFGENERIDFVDGVVVFRTGDLSGEIRRHQPAYRGAPFGELLRINPAVLFGNTWMIRRKPDVSYQFHTGLKFAEDLFFYLTISQGGGVFSYTSEEILWYRRHGASAMNNIEGLEKGYQNLYTLVKGQLNASPGQLLYLKYKISRIMFATYLKGEKRLLKAFTSLWKNIRL